MTHEVKFMIKLFDKFQKKDFYSDRFLKGFYKSYENERKQNETISLFNYFMEYLLRNIDYDIKDQQKKIDELCKNIKNALLQPKQSNTSNSSNVSNKKKKIKINKKDALKILGDFIKSSCIITYEDPEAISNLYDEKFRAETTKNIIEEIKASGQFIPKAQKDVIFNRRNKMLEIWRDTEYKCIKFIENSRLANVLKKIYFVDGSKINTSTENILTLPCLDVLTINSEIQQILNNPIVDIKYFNDKINSSIPIERVTNRHIKNTYNANILVTNQSAIYETKKYNKQQTSTVYICSASQMIPGGAADQGVETNESIIYYTTSYNIGLSQVEMAYPLLETQMLVFPNILLFKDHITYQMLPPEDGQRISIIMSPMTYRPRTNISKQNQYKIDQRLLLPNCKFQNAEIISKRFDAMFNTALFFGYDTIILDDQGVDDFWLPVHHTAELLSLAINKFKNLFKNIIVAIPSETFYPVFKKYIN